jgi:hypothetical protein
MKEVFKSDSVAVYDDVLPADSLKALQDVFLGKTIPWYYHSGVVTLDQDDPNLFYFVHILFHEHEIRSAQFALMKPLLDLLDVKSLIKIKANLVTKTDKIIEQGYHSDQPYGKTCVFYFNTNNGYTQFKDGMKVESVENRLLVFDATQLHTGSTCTDEKVRVVLNINFF